eukprot:GHVS01045251.1.p1 GENE.GHVS01045251.1~~GHVS01045251.1.p1  ORF type:complete len:370 (+),score=72.69 GHVS01045251.1:350-1459(+)
MSMPPISSHLQSSSAESLLLQSFCQSPFAPEVPRTLPSLPTTHRSSCIGELPTVDIAPSLSSLTCAFPTSASSSTCFSSSFPSDNLAPEQFYRARRGRGRPRGSRASKPRVSRRTMSVATLAWARQQQHQMNAAVVDGRSERVTANNGATKYCRIQPSPGGCGGTSTDPDNNAYLQRAVGEEEAVGICGGDFHSILGTTVIRPVVGHGEDSAFSGGGGDGVSPSFVVSSPLGLEVSYLSATSSQFMYSMVSHAISEDDPKLAIPTFHFSRRLSSEDLGISSDSFPSPSVLSDCHSSLPPSSSLSSTTASSSESSAMVVCHVDFKTVTSEARKTEREILELPKVDPMYHSKPLFKRGTQGGGHRGVPTMG